MKKKFTKFTLLTNNDIPYTNSIENDEHNINSAHKKKTGFFSLSSLNNSKQLTELRQIKDKELDKILDDYLESNSKLNIKPLIFGNKNIQNEKNFADPVSPTSPRKFINCTKFNIKIIPTLPLHLCPDSFVEDIKDGGNSPAKIIQITSENLPAKMTPNKIHFGTSICTNTNQMNQGSPKIKSPKNDIFREKMMSLSISTRKILKNETEIHDMKSFLESPKNINTNNIKLMNQCPLEGKSPKNDHGGMEKMTSSYNLSSICQTKNVKHATEFHQSKYIFGNSIPKAGTQAVVSQKMVGYLTKKGLNPRFKRPDLKIKIDLSHLGEIKAINYQETTAITENLAKTFERRMTKSLTLVHFVDSKLY